MAVTKWNQIPKLAEKFFGKYSVVSIEIDYSGKGYKKAWVTFTDGSSVLVTRIPSTSTTPDGFIAQNCLKSAYIAKQLSKNTACYSS
jgi:hypothetical protein